MRVPSLSLTRFAAVGDFVAASAGTNGVTPFVAAAEVAAPQLRVMWIVIKNVFVTAFPQHLFRLDAIQTILG